MAGETRMPWFKWWDGTCADMKLRMLADDLKVPAGIVIAVWAYHLELASRSADRGTVGMLDQQALRQMAYTLQFDMTTIETVCNGMKRDGLVTETGEIKKWEERQAKREKSEPPGASTKRVQALRERQKAMKNNGLVDGNGCNGNVTDETDGTEGNDTKRPKKKRREDVDTKPKPSSSSGDDGAAPKTSGFDEFWAAYPRKVGKQDAQKAWTKLKLDASLPDLLSAIAAQKDGADWRRDDGEYIPHPATWLRGGRWLDEVRPYVAPPLKLPPGWWETKEGMEAAGAMLTPPLKPRQGEYPKEFVARIRMALGQIDAPASAAPAAPPCAAPAEYIPPAPPADVILSEEQREARREEFREQLAKLKQNEGLAKAGIAAANTGDLAGEQAA